MIASTRGLRRFLIVRILWRPYRGARAFLPRDDARHTGSVLLPTKPSDQLDSINASAAGLGGKAGSGSWTSTKEWQEYQQDLDHKWSYLNRIRLNAMKTWGGSALGGLRDKTGTVYYPFSGPDALYVDTLFPDSKIVIMAGLEPVGTMPDLAKLEKDGRLGPYLEDVQKSLYTILTASFFKTKDMKNDFNNNLVDGLMPAMIVFLARQGYRTSRTCNS